MCVKFLCPVQGNAFAGCKISFNCKYLLGDLFISFDSVGMEALGQNSDPFLPHILGCVTILTS